MIRVQNLFLFFIFIFISLPQSGLASIDSIYVDWVRRYSDYRAVNQARKVLLDGTGNIYVSGEAFDPLGDSNLDIVKYNYSGQKLWAVEYPRAIMPVNAAYTALDRNGNIYSSVTDVLSGELLTIKHKGMDGSVDWVKHYMGAYGIASSLLIDSNSNIYVSATIWDSLHYQGFVTIKYDTNGVEKWSKIFDINMGDETQTHLINDSLWNLYVVGYNASSDSLSGIDVLVVKYDSSGTELWRSSFSTPGNWDDIPTDVVIDGQNRLLILMRSDNKSVIARFDTAGNISWISDIFNNAIAKNIAIDTNNNIVFSALKITNQGSKFFIAKMDSRGILLWSELFEGISPNGVTGLTGLILDDQNNIYISGQVLEQNYNSKMTIIKYSSNGNLVWFFPYEDPISYEDAVSDFILDDNNNIILTGTGFTNEPGSYYSTIKLIQEAVVGITNAGIPVMPYQLSNNYPNPFNPTTIIRYALPRSEYVTLKVYDMQGKEIATLVKAHQPAGFHSVVFDGRRFSSGIYVYRIQAGGFSQVRKMMLIK